jgi:hypothetical protein
MNAAQAGEGSEEMGFKLTPLVSGNGLRTTEARNPTSQEGAGHSIGSDDRDGDRFRPTRKAVHRSEAVGAAVGGG